MPWRKKSSIRSSSAPESSLGEADELGVAVAHAGAHHLVVAGGVGLVLEHQVVAVGGEQLQVRVAPSPPGCPRSRPAPRPSRNSAAARSNARGDPFEGALQRREEQLTLVAEQREHVRLGHARRAARCAPPGCRADLRGRTRARRLRSAPRGARPRAPARGRARRRSSGLPDHALRARTDGHGRALARGAGLERQREHRQRAGAEHRHADPQRRGEAVDERLRGAVAARVGEDRRRAPPRPAPRRSRGSRWWRRRPARPGRRARRRAPRWRTGANTSAIPAPAITNGTSISA